MADGRLAVAGDPKDDRALMVIAARLAGELGLSMDTRGADMVLTVTPARLELRVIGDRGRPVFADLLKVNVTSNAGRTLKQPLARAVGLRKRSDLPINVIDATAGFGEDAWLMASLGCDVTAIERCGAVAALLRDGIKEAGASPAAKRIKVVRGDALQALARMHADVVYLDPMFPAKRKTAQRKAMVVLRRVVGEDVDADALLGTAMGAARRRVVVKRPSRATPLAGREPSHTHRGKAMRYDVYIV